MKCEKCGKDKVKTTCSNCLGNGSEPSLVIFSKTCQACNGKGYYMRCPDFRAHERAAFKSLLSRSRGESLFTQSRGSTGPKPLTQLTRPGPQTCPSCKGTGSITIKPSGNPVTPTQWFNHLQGRDLGRVTCPVCKGRGKV